MDNKNATIISTTQFSIGLLIWNLILEFVFSVFILLVFALLNLIPIIGSIIYFIIAGIFIIGEVISVIGRIIGSIRSKATLTDNGIYGNQYVFGTFDLTFDKITKITLNKKLIRIFYIDSAGKKRKIQIFGVSEAKAFYKECKHQFDLYKAGGTTVATEAAVAEDHPVEAESNVEAE